MTTRPYRPAAGTVQMVAAVCAMLTALGVAWIGYLTQTARHGVEQVRTTLAAAKESTDEKLGEIHILVNSQMSAALNVNRITTKRLAEMPGATAEDIEAAQLAQDAYNEHQRRQAAADSQKE